LIQKHVANTGQLSKRLYHMLISFVRDWADGLAAAIGDSTRGERESSRRDNRLIRLYHQHEFTVFVCVSVPQPTNVDLRTNVRSSRSLSISCHFEDRWIAPLWVRTYPHTRPKLLSSFKPSLKPIFILSNPILTYLAQSPDLSGRDSSPRSIELLADVAGKYPPPLGPDVLTYNPALPPPVEGDGSAYRAFEDDDCGVLYSVCEGRRSGVYALFTLVGRFGADEEAFPAGAEDVVRL
jgi:hypothetical protein